LGRMRPKDGAPACKASSANAGADGYRPRFAGLAGDSERAAAAADGGYRPAAGAGVGESWGGAAAYRDDESREYTSQAVARARGFVVYRPTGEVLSSVIADVQRERRERIDDGPRSERGPSTEAPAPKPVVSGHEPFG
jgi:hypothetical protein